MKLPHNRVTMLSLDTADEQVSIQVPRMDYFVGDPPSTAGCCKCLLFPCIKRQQDTSADDIT